MSRLCSSLLLSLLVAASAHATATYQYTGNPFTTFSAPPNPYSAANFVTVTLTLPGPLGANLDLEDVMGSAISLSMSDGLQMMDLSTPDLVPDDTEVRFSTDAQGMIVLWSLQMLRATGATLLTDAADDLGGDASGSYGAVYNSPGTWSLVPEPGIVTLLAMGLLGLAGWRRVGG